jgi:hypothetical protein
VKEVGKGKNSKYNRSNSKNPNNPAYKAAMDNRANQLNPNNPHYQGGPSYSESDFNFPNHYTSKTGERYNTEKKNKPKKKHYKTVSKPARVKYSTRYNPLKFKVKTKPRKTIMTLKAFRRIQSHADKTSRNQKFKARAQRSSYKRK